MGDFVWHIKGIDIWPGSSENWRSLFLVIFSYFWFLAGILKLCSFCGLLWQNVTCYENFCLFIPLSKLNFAFSEGTIHLERSKEEQNFKHGTKFTKREKITQNSNLLFSEKLGHVSVHLICQTKSPTLTDKWLKVFPNILNYAGDIGCQSCVTNFGLTQCRYSIVLQCDLCMLSLLISLIQPNPSKPF